MEAPTRAPSCLSDSRVVTVITVLPHGDGSPMTGAACKLLLRPHFSPSSRGVGHKPTHSFPPETGLPSPNQSWHLQPSRTAAAAPQLPHSPRRPKIEMDSLEGKRQQTRDLSSILTASPKQRGQTHTHQPISRSLRGMLKHQPLNS